MKILIPGLKQWPYHHEVEHLMAEALAAGGHTVCFLGCSRDGMSACECVDKAVSGANGGHASFCASCHTRQGGVHKRAGFREIPMPADESVEGGIRLLLDSLDVAGILGMRAMGIPLRELLGPSLMRWARSGRPVEESVPLGVLRDHAAQALRMEALLPILLRREGIEMVLLLNGLFLSERMITEIARGMGLRVVNYERGHARNTLLFSTAEPACFLEIGEESARTPMPDEDALLDAYLEGRAHNRDASTEFGTGRSAGSESPSGESRTTVAVLTNVCWDSAVSARASGFGTYLNWLESVLDLAAARPELEFALRVHPGEARLVFDPTLDRTEAWLAERRLPPNLLVIGADDPASTADLMLRAAAVVVYVTSAGLEAACQGSAVVTCGDVHYAGHGFTIDCAGPEHLSACLGQAISAGRDPLRARLARRYASRLFLDAPTPFHWVDEVEYGRPQRVMPRIDAGNLARDPLLGGLVAFLAGAADRPHSLRELLADPGLCPLPFHFGSRLSPPARVGVLITAHQRPEELGRAMQAWANQDLPVERFQLLIVDDGSQPPLEPPLREALARIRAGGGQLDVELMRLERNGGPARARNAGIQHLLNQPIVPEMLLITGDDILPAADALSCVLAEHGAWNDPRVAVLGRVEWDQRLGCTRVMRLVERNGMQFGFHDLPARCRLPGQYFYTSSVAIPTAFLRTTGLRFAEDFPHAAWEDVDFGVRAIEHGLILAYDGRIRFHHDHPTDYASFARRQRKAGASARVFHARRSGDFAAICGEPPADPPDRIVMRGLEGALGELSKLDLAPLRMLPAPGGTDLATHLDREQDRLLETLFRLHSDAGWFSAPLMPEGPGVGGLLSVLIPVYDQAQLTSACLDALRANSRGPLEIIVVDNASTDDSARLLAGQSDVITITMERNLGFARATNMAAAGSTGEHLVLLNNDTEVQPGWDLPLREELASRKVGAVGLRLLYQDGTVQHAGLAFGPDGLPWHLYRGFPGEASEVMRRRPFNALTGACLGVRRDVWRLAGGLDENFINCYEDVDLCLRLRELGYDLIYRPDGVVLHHEGRTAGRDNRVAHGWLTLLERWAGRLPGDEADLLAEDGWEAVRHGGALRLRRINGGGRASAARIRRESEQLMAGGEIQGARDLLESSLRDGAVERQDELRRALLELELRVGNLSAAQRLAGCCKPRPDQQTRLSQLRHDVRRHFEENGIQANL